MLVEHPGGDGTRSDTAAALHGQLELCVGLFPPLKQGGNHAEA
ncbi:MAG TPA: hypothetical protein VNB87_16325 [Propionibacteriaceae bacterium]|jgi:hypothetical protein|nr:hypothetical protein [Propionibacteriaceae bacterium]